MAYANPAEVGVSSLDECMELKVVKKSEMFADLENKVVGGDFYDEMLED